MCHTSARYVTCWHRKGMETQVNTTNGKIAQQSKEKLVKALLNIMEQYDYREITITQIAQEAELSRKTFYRLFKGKRELLHFFFDASYKYSFEIFAYVRPAETVKEYAAFLPYLLAYSIGGMYSMVLKWVESGMEVPSAVLIEKLKEGFTSPEF